MGSAGRLMARGPASGKRETSSLGEELKTVDRVADMDPSLADEDPKESSIRGGGRLGRETRDERRETRVETTTAWPAC